MEPVKKSRGTFRAFLVLAAVFVLGFVFGAGAILLGIQKMTRRAFTDAPEASLAVDRFFDRVEARFSRRLELTPEERAVVHDEFSAAGKEFKEDRHGYLQAVKKLTNDTINRICQRLPADKADAFLALAKKRLAPWGIEIDQEAPRAGSETAHSSGYKLDATWKPGGAGRWDYMEEDPAAGRLYIARENRVQVLDTRTGALAGEVPGLNQAHGIALVPTLHRGFATSGSDGKVIAFDLATLQPAAAPITAGTKPDAIVYDPKSNRVFAMNGESHDVTVIDPAAAKAIGEIALPGAPEFAAVDGAGQLFVNIEDKSLVVAIDTAAMKVTQTWPLAPGENPSGLSIDAAGHHLFAGCRNQMLIVLDDATGQVQATLPIGAHVDATRFDSGTGFAFSSNGDGTLTVAAADATGAFKVIDTIPTKFGARTMEVDPNTHAVYLCTADFGPPDANSNGRPVPVPGTFVVLRYVRSP